MLRLVRMADIQLTCWKLERRCRLGVVSVNTRRPYAEIDFGATFGVFSTAAEFSRVCFSISDVQTMRCSLVL